MGHRANYAIREKGEIVLHYSHWGALTIAEDVFWGSENTEKFIRKNEVRAGWLDNVWAEGGIALDKDTSLMTYYCREWPVDSDIRRTYEALLARIWASHGWTVERVEEWGDLANAVGVDRTLVTALPTAPGKITVGELGRNLKAFRCCALLSVRTRDGWHDKAIDFYLAGFLMNGPELLQNLPEIANLEKLRAVFADRPEADTAKTPGDWLDEFCAVDLLEKTLRLCLQESSQESVPFLREAWSGWTIVNESGGIGDHFRHMGRSLPADLVPSPNQPEPEPPNRPFDECLRLINEHLAGNEQHKSELLASHAQLLQELARKERSLTVAPGFLQRIPES